MGSENNDMKNELEAFKSPDGKKKLRRMKSNPQEDYDVKVDPVNTFNPGPHEHKNESFDSENMKSFDENEDVKKTIDLVKRESLPTDTANQIAEFS